MKKIILTVAAVFAFGFVNAQDVKFGVKGGVNLANFGGDAEGTDAKIGFNVGGFAEIKVSDKFAIQPELLYSVQGAKSSESGSGYSYEYKENLSYINIPVMAKYYVADKFSLEAGPQVGFLISAKSKYDVTSGGVNATGTEDSKDDYNTLDLGANFGAGYDFTENVSVGVRYNLGLSNIAKDSGDFKATNNVISLSVGYKF